MADDQGGQSEIGEDAGVADYGGNDANDGHDIGDTADLSSTPTTPVAEDGGNSAFNDFADDDEPLEDYVVNLVINDQPDGVTVTDLVTAAITDEYGNVITTTPWQDAIDGYTRTITQEIQDGITGNGTSIGEKGWWGNWTWHKGLVVGLIALCIIGIILALLFIILGRRKRATNKKPAKTDVPATAERKGVKKGVTQDPKYSAVPTNV